MNKRLTISEVRDDLADTVNRVAYTKERVILHRRGKNLVAVVPMEDLERLERLEAENTAMEIPVANEGPSAAEQMAKDADPELLHGVDALVQMDDEAGLYAREVEIFGKTSR